MGTYKLSDALTTHLCQLIEVGVPVSSAVSVVGISKPTFYLWMRDGEKAKSGKMRTFFESVSSAKDKAIARNVSIVQKAASEGTWQAAAWWLERTCPEEFGRDKQNVNVAIQNNTQVVVSENIKERIKKYESIFEDIES